VFPIFPIEKLGNTGPGPDFFTAPVEPLRLFLI
jgi:hypothetical protein